MFAIIIANQCLIGILHWCSSARRSLHVALVAVDVPFDLSALGVILGKFAYVSPLPGLPQATFAVLSALIAHVSGHDRWTWQHRVPLALWPRRTTRRLGSCNLGPVQVRKTSVYTSLTLAELAAFLSFPSLLTAIAWCTRCSRSRDCATGGAQAAASPFGSEYRAYMEVTGRLLPGIVACRDWVSAMEHTAGLGGKMARFVRFIIQQRRLVGAPSCCRCWRRATQPARSSAFPVSRLLRLSWQPTGGAVST